MPTELGKKVLRLRMSVRETQEEFAERFRVTTLTIHNWECGKTEKIQKIHKEMLDTLVKQLKHEGRYMPDDLFSIIYRTQIESRGNAMA